MKNLLLILAVFAGYTLTSSFGCKSKKSATEATTVNTSCSTSAVIKEEGYSLPEDNAGFTIESHTMVGNVLTLNISYSGGCEKHEFKAYFTGMFLKSMPPKANLLIYHKNNGDACRELKQETICFDLTNMRYGTKGPLMVQIAGYDKSPIEYKY